MATVPSAKLPAAGSHDRSGCYGKNEHKSRDVRPYGSSIRGRTHLRPSYLQGSRAPANGLPLVLHCAVPSRLIAWLQGTIEP